MGPARPQPGGTEAPAQSFSRGRLGAVEEKRVMSQKPGVASTSMLVEALFEHVFCPDTAEVASSILAAPTISGPGEAPASPTSSSWTAVRRQRWDRGPGDPAPVPSR